MRSCVTFKFRTSCRKDEECSPEWFVNMEFGLCVALATITSPREASLDRKELGLSQFDINRDSQSLHAMKNVIVSKMKFCF